MQFYRTIASNQDPASAQKLIAEHLARSGYQQQSADPDLVYRYPAGGTTFRRRPATLTARINPGAAGTSSIYLNLEVDLGSQAATSQESAACEAELDAVVAAVQGSVIRRGVVAGSSATPRTIVGAARPVEALAPGPAMAEAASFFRGMQIKRAANWFYFIAALSLINSALGVAGGIKASFPVGLGATQVVDGLSLIMAAQAAVSLRPAFGILAFAADVCIAGIFVFFGLSARRRRLWAFTAGMILYFLDGLLFLTVPDYLSIGFHLFALIGLFSGWRAVRHARHTPDGHSGSS